MARPLQRSVELFIGGRCGLSCAPCDCRARAADAESVGRTLKGGGGRLVLRGGGGRPGEVADVVARARQEGFAEAVLRTNAIGFAANGAAAELRAQGVDGVLVPLFSHAPAVHDRIAGRASALTEALVGMRALAAAGLSVEVEIPLLSRRLQDLSAVVELAYRAVPSLRAARFFLPSAAMPPALAPPPWSASTLAQAITKCREIKVAVSLRGTDGIPLCALGDRDDLYDAFRFNPRGRAPRAAGATFPKACEGCVAKKQCPGVSAAYAAANGEADITPFKKRPASLYAQRTGQARKWDDEQRRAASQATMLVLRPTVNCNQDCTFCSANETTGNVWSDSGEMLRQIARAARRGITWLSFSGGEPTLSRDLPSYIRAAHRCGIKYIEIVTNGVLLDSEKRVAELRDAGLTQAFVSLHAHEESLSRLATQKVGDFGRTVKAVKLMLDAGIATGLNHVITARNYRFIERFIELCHAEFDGRTMISLSLVTPQYKALEDLEQMPRISDVMPYLRRAMRRALELGQPFTVGSRQGIPPCFLKEFAGWSDLMKHAHEARSEDAPQKKRSPRCDECRYTNLCVGVWRPYAELYGTDELIPVEGEPFDDEQVRTIARSLPLGAWSFQRSFDDVASVLRDRKAEADWPPAADADPSLDPARETERVHLPVFTLKRSRPLRIALFGSGPRARRLAAAARQIQGLSIDAVASPHAPDSDLRELGGCPSFREASDALDAIRPEGVIIAAATSAHYDLAKLAALSNAPSLIEKPLTQHIHQAEDLESNAGGALMMPAHNVLFADGLDALWNEGAATHVRYEKRCPKTSQDVPRMWSKSSLYETLYHALALVVHAAGGGFTKAEQVTFRGDTRPERIHVLLTSATATAELTLDYAAPVDEMTLACDGDLTWRRLGRETTIARGSRVTPVMQTGSDIERMLARFRDAILGEAKPGVTVSEAIDVMRATSLVIDELARAGAPFDRPHAPKHVASKSLARF